VARSFHFGSVAE
jgi:hypothetical protein